MISDDYKAIQVLMKMYSFESFLYREISNSSKQQEPAKSVNLGPYAYLLTKILQRFNPNINVGADYVFQTRAPGFVTYKGTSLTVEKYLQVSLTQKIASQTPRAHRPRLLACSRRWRRRRPRRRRRGRRRRSGRRKPRRATACPRGCDSS